MSRTVPEHEPWGTVLNIETVPLFTKKERDMYNKMLEPLLLNDPQKTISSFGIRIRKALYPVFRFIIPKTLGRRLVLVSRGKYRQDEPLIFVSTHEFREDAEAAYVAAGMPVYLLNGSVSIVMNSFDGFTNWLAGMILVDRTSRDSRRAAKEKMIYAIEKGASIVIYPEGTWNKSPNQLISGLFPGVYAVAKATGARVVAMAHQRGNDVIYSKVGDAFDVSGMSEADAMETIKENMATLKYELIEEFGKCCRTDLPLGPDAEIYWKHHIDGLMAEVPLYDYELEKHTKYIEKDVTLPCDAFLFYKKMKPKLNNAFLYRGMEYWWG